MTVPRAMNSSVALVPFPDTPQVPEPLRGRHVYHVRIAFTGSAGNSLVEPLRRIGPRLMEVLRDMPYAESAGIHNDPLMPMPWTADDALLNEPDGKAMETVLDHVGPGTPLPAIVELRHLGGALADRPAHPNAVGHRDAQFMLSVLTPLWEVTAAEAHSALQALFQSLAPWTAGRFVNLMGHGDNAGPEQVRTAYDASDHERLSALKAVYDPRNTFRLNYNIPPARGAPGR
jgi:hypothetical protein